jgi:hypothetical protein
MRMMRSTIVVLLSLCAGLLARSASADEPSEPDRDTCRSAYEQGQRLRRSHKLRESREKLMLCARDPCPAVFQPECAKWLSELDAELPTVVVALQGHLDGPPPHVLVDGSPFAPSVDGIARPIDPGPHEFVVESGDTRLVLRAAVVEGTKAQRVLLVVPGSAATDEPPTRSAAIPPLALGVGALGVAALATSTFFGVRGLGQKSDIDACTPNCSLDDVHSARQTFLISDVALGVGVVAIGAAVILYLTRPYEAPAAAALRLDRTTIRF